MSPDDQSLIVLFVLIVLISAIFYFIPTMVAVKRKCRNRTGIIVVNIVLGWTFAVWVVALVWAMIDPIEDGDDHL